jgi:hypothetical protein
MQEYVTRFAMQSAEATSSLAIFGRLDEKSKVDRQTLITLSSLEGLSGRLVGFVKLETDRTVIDIGGASFLTTRISQISISVARRS